MKCISCEKEFKCKWKSRKCTYIPCICLNCYLNSMMEEYGENFSIENFIYTNKKCYYNLTKEKLLIEVL